MIGDMELVGRVARELETPCYLYRLDHVVARAHALRIAFGNKLKISYAVKSNPNPAILARLRGIVDYLDVSSGGEVLLALNSGWAPHLLSFTGPAKRDVDLKIAVDNRIGDVVIESLGEAERLNAVATAKDHRQPVLLRIAPVRLPRGFGVKMAGRPSQFGIDEENVDEAIHFIRQLSYLDLEGLHIYSGTQCLNADSLAENYGIFLEIFERACCRHQLRPRRLVLGSGLGIPYHKGDEAVDLEAVATKTNPMLDAFLAGDARADTELLLETGRYLVGEAGFYLTGVVSIKHSRGTDFVICDGGMNHHLGACGHLGSVIPRAYRMFKVPRSCSEEAVEMSRHYNLVGPLCTTIDTLGHDVTLPTLAVGDIVAVRSSGAYGLTASPLHFIAHPPPREYLVESGEVGAPILDVTEFAARPGSWPTTGESGGTARHAERR